MEDWCCASWRSRLRDARLAIKKLDARRTSCMGPAMRPAGQDQCGAFFEGAEAREWTIVRQ
jgi:hypothetical protein